MTDPDTDVLSWNGLRLALSAAHREDNEAVFDEVLTMDLYARYWWRDWFAAFAPDRPPVLIDAGGNIGAFAVAVKSVRPDARIYAFEPNPPAAALYRETVRINGWSDVVVEESALGGVRGQRAFLTGDALGFGGSRLVGANTPSPAATHSAVPCVRLADWLDEAGIKTVDGLKMDIEGAEWEVFSDPEAGLAGRVAVLMGECHADPDAPDRPLSEFAPLAGNAVGMEVELTAWVRRHAVFGGCKAPGFRESLRAVIRETARRTLIFHKSRMTDIGIAETRHWWNAYQALAGIPVLRHLLALRRRWRGVSGPREPDFWKSFE